MPYKNKELEKENKHRYWLRLKKDKKRLKHHHDICRRDYQKHKKERLTKQNSNNTKYRQLLDLLKINGCAICGYNKCKMALDFHHANPEDMKFRLVLHGIRRKNDDVANELNKCILLCANCHREIHNSERGWIYTNSKEK